MYHQKPTRPGNHTGNKPKVGHSWRFRGARASDISHEEQVANGMAMAAYRKRQKQQQDQEDEL